MYDVIVIGAGIVGSYTAHELARLGYSVCVLEKQPRPGHKTSCTGIVSRACLEMLPAGPGIIQWEAHSAKIFSPAGKYIRVERDSTQAYILDRAALDRLMAKQAKAKGAEFHFSTTVSGARTDGNCVQVQATRHGEPGGFTARAAVIASGSAAGITRSAGLGQVHEYAQGAQAQAERKNVAEVEVYSGAGTAPGFFAWLVPSSQAHVKVGLLCRGNPKPYITALLERLAQQGKINQAVHDISYGTIPLKPISRTYTDRLLVVGDAAGQAKPTTGGGIYFGLLCARLAVQTLDESLKINDLSKRRLALYQRRWHKVLKNELAIDYWAHRFYQELDDKQIEHIFKIIERHGIHESLLASPDITFDWHSLVILDAIKHRSLQRSLEKLKAAPFRLFDGRTRSN